MTRREGEGESAPSWTSWTSWKPVEEGEYVRMGWNTATRNAERTFSTTGAGAALGASFLETLSAFFDSLGVVALAAFFESFLVSDLAIMIEMMGSGWENRQIRQVRHYTLYIYRSRPFAPRTQNFVKKVQATTSFDSALVISLTRFI